MFHLNKDAAAAVADSVYWHPILTCPKHVKVQLYTKGGVAVMGVLKDHPLQSSYIYWAPLPRVPEDLL